MSICKTCRGVGRVRDGMLVTQGAAKSIGDDGKPKIINVHDTKHPFTTRGVYKDCPDCEGKGTNE